MTRERKFEELVPAVRQSIQAHVDRYHLGQVLSDALMCVETASQKARRGLFGGRAETVVVAAIITPKWLIWAIRAERPEVTVMSARLSDIVVQDYEISHFAQLVPDRGIEVSGSFTDAPERGTAFIGLGPEPIALKFKQIVLGQAGN